MSNRHAPGLQLLLDAVACNISDELAASAAADYILEFDAPDVRIYHAIPVWFHKIWKSRVPERFCSSNHYAKSYRMYYHKELDASFRALKCKTSLDHWGSTSICGIPSLVCDPYADAEMVRHDAAIFRKLLGIAVIGIPGGGGWRYGKTDRIAFFAPSGE